ncbi:MAG: ketol-acid reductoisomerase [Opitutae bacterium]|nr:ketol-acid reductoisomerase [Opitutae bacterium]
MSKFEQAPEPASAPATIHFADAADPALIRARRVAVVGYGAQGRAQALNLRDSGVAVRVGLASGSASRAGAAADGFAVGTAAEVAAWADVIVLLAPDGAQPRIYADEIAPRLAPGKALGCAHGFNVHFGAIVPPAGVDVVLVAPKGPGKHLRDLYVGGGGLPALLAVAQDATGHARALALSYAWAIGCARAGVIETTFAEETETDLFGEQAVLCGGVMAVVKAAFETLVAAGYQPEVAYIECLHELRLTVDLMCRGGMTQLGESISDTAEWGGLRAGPRLVNGTTHIELTRLLGEIRSGKFAREWLAECAAGQSQLERMRAIERLHPVEEVGRRLRARLPLLNPAEGG